MKKSSDLNQLTFYTFWEHLTTKIEFLIEKWLEKKKREENPRHNNPMHYEFRFIIS